MNYTRGRVARKIWVVRGARRGEHAAFLVFLMMHAKPFSLFFSLFSNAFGRVSTFAGALVALAAVFVFAPDAGAQEGEAAGQNFFEKNGIVPVHGPALVKLGRYAEIDLPEGFVFVGEPYLKKFYDATQNSYSGSEIGVIVSHTGWVIFFDYMDSGHIDDSDRSELDADKLYKELDKNMRAGNLQRKGKGWDERVLKGWTSKPHYDEKTNNLTWAFRMASSSDNYNAITINQNIRLLGRTGFVSAVVSSDGGVDYARTEAEANELLKNFRFTQGQTYAEFRSGDKVAQYGLAALVLGGAGAVAAKTGFLAKFWKIIVVGVVAVGGWFAKMFKKLFRGGGSSERFGDNSNP